MPGGLVEVRLAKWKEASLRSRASTVQTQNDKVFTFLQTVSTLWR